MKIKDLSADERPREKMLARGAGSLSDGELLAVLLRSGNRESSALDLARQLLALADGHLSTLFHLSQDKMFSLPGIGPGKASSVLAAFELGRRFLQEEFSLVKKPLLTARSVYEMMIPQLKGLRHEECWILFLNDHGRRCFHGCCGSLGNLFLLSKGCLNFRNNSEACNDQADQDQYREHGTHADQGIQSGLFHELGEACPRIQGTALQRH